jgi:hypothetical protein
MSYDRTDYLNDNPLKNSLAGLPPSLRFLLRYSYGGHVGAPRPRFYTTPESPAAIPWARDEFGFHPPESEYLFRSPHSEIRISVDLVVPAKSSGHCSHNCQRKKRRFFDHKYEMPLVYWDQRTIRFSDGSGTACNMVEEGYFAKKTVNTHGLNQVTANVKIYFTGLHNIHHVSIFAFIENDASRQEGLGTHFFLKDVGQLHGRFVCISRAGTEGKSTSLSFASARESIRHAGSPKRRDNS